MHGHNMDNDQGGIADTLMCSDRRHIRPALDHRCQPGQNDDQPVRHGIDNTRNIADTWHISTQQYRLPYDNAPMESFHASLKKECVYPVPVFEDYETAAAVLFEYVHAFYNRKRIHSSLGYQTPLQVEVATLTSQMAA